LCVYISCDNSVGASLLVSEAHAWLGFEKL